MINICTPILVGILNWEIKTNQSCAQSKNMNCIDRCHNHTIIYSFHNCRCIRQNITKNYISPHDWTLMIESLESIVIIIIILIVYRYICSIATESIEPLEVYIFSHRYDGQETPIGQYNSSTGHSAEFFPQQWDSSTILTFFVHHISVNIIM